LEKKTKNKTKTDSGELGKEKKKSLGASKSERRPELQIPAENKGGTAEPRPFHERPPSPLLSP
jgi:hypothetical protein